MNFNPLLPVQRIAMLSVHTCPLALLGGKKTGGMNVYVRDFSRILDHFGVQVDVFTRSQDDCQPYIKHEIGGRGRVIHIPAGPERPMPVAEIEQHLDEFVEGVLDFAASEGARYDLIHSHYWLSGLVAERLSEIWRNIPIVQMFHTLGHMKNRIATQGSQRAPQSRIDGEMRVIQRVERLIAATPAEEAQLNQLYGASPDKITIIPPGVDLARFHPVDPAAAKARIGMDAEQVNLLFAGRIEPLKGVDTLLEAVALLKQRHPEAMCNASLTIVGGDPHADTLDDEMARLQEMRANLGLHDLVTFAGAKNQEVLPDYYAASAVVVMPSHYESFGMVALEAMAMGTPVIASEVGGLAHLVQDAETGFHVPPRDPEALAACLHDLLAQPALRQRLGQQAQTYAQRYDWCRIVERMMGMYAEVVGAELPVGVGDC